MTPSTRYDPFPARRTTESPGNPGDSSGSSAWFPQTKKQKERHARKGSLFFTNTRARQSASKAGSTGLGRNHPHSHAA